MRSRPGNIVSHNNYVRLNKQSIHGRNGLATSLLPYAPRDTQSIRKFFWTDFSTGTLRNMSNAKGRLRIGKCLQVWQRCSKQSWTYGLGRNGDLVRQDQEVNAWCVNVRKKKGNKHENGVLQLVPHIYSEQKLSMDWLRGLWIVWIPPWQHHFQLYFWQNGRGAWSTRPFPPRPTIDGLMQGFRQRNLEVDLTSMLVAVGADDLQLVRMQWSKIRMIQV